MERIVRELNWIRSVGVVNWLLLTSDRIRRKFGRGLPTGPKSAALRVLAVNRDGRPLLYRPGTSDPLVYHQIFVEREYSPLDHVEPVETVIDCGANVGYSSAWFLTRFPTCRLLALEPDSANFEVLSRNLEGHGGRALLRNEALWSSACTLVANQQPYRDGREWAHQFVESDGQDSNGVRAIGVLDAMRLLDAPRISLLKIDIEGAEAVVFRQERGQWLHLVDTLVVELHSDSCFGDARREFVQLMKDQPFTIIEHGELTICRRK